jgi:hypothetical protein
MRERLGHASSQITMNLYTHVIPGMQAPTPQPGSVPYGVPTVVALTKH